MKKFGVIGIVSLLVLLCGCWIHPITTDYEKIDDTYYFYDFESMEDVIIPLLNTSFPDWHYNKKKFRKRYEEYLNCLEKDEASYNYLQNSDYAYAVKYGISNGTIAVTKPVACKIIKQYYWITEKDGDSLIFFEDKNVH